MGSNLKYATVLLYAPYNLQIAVLCIGSHGLYLLQEAFATLK
jgi:hypothetical protein